MTEKDHKALSRLIMYDKIKRLYEVEHRSIRWIAKQLGINFRTVRKYLKMDHREFESYSDKVISRAHILEPYKDFIIGKLSLYPDTPAAQMHDWLKECHADLPKVAPKTVYNYVMKIRQEYNLPKVCENERQYAALPETAPGEYAQVDFGQTKLRRSDGNRIRVYFIAILLCYSRYKFIWFQDKPFTSETAVTGHEKAFAFFRGVPKNLVYDQDAVFLYDENVGDYRMTQVFENYVKSRPFRVIFCRPADPESKGKVENVVKYVKQNFLLNRQFSSVDNLNAEALAWLERTGNAMIHNTTCKVPYDMWCRECKDLLPYIPVTAPEAKSGHKVLKTNSVKYRGNTYSLPLGTYRGEDTRVYLSEEKGDLVIRNIDDAVIARHLIPAGRGQMVINKNHARDTSVSVSEKCEYVKGLFTDQESVCIFLARVRERYPRYMRDQLATLINCVTKYGQKRADEVLAECVRNKLFSATDFKEIITSGPAPCAEDITVIKPLGDATAKLMVNVEPNRSSIDVYDDLFKAS